MNRPTFPSSTAEDWLPIDGASVLRRGLLGLILFGAAASGFAQTRYTMEVLYPGGIRKEKRVEVDDINSSGERVGSRYPVDYSTPAIPLRWTADGKPTRLVSSVGQDLRATAINDQGIAAGQLYIEYPSPDQGVKAAVFLRSGEAKIISPPGTYAASATAINDLGVVAGNVDKEYKPRFLTTGFLWSEAAGWREIPTPDGWEPRVRITGLNNLGVVVGDNREFPKRSFYYDEGGGVQPLPMDATYTTGINDRNEIVGWTAFGEGFVFTIGGQLRLLPKLEGAYVCRAEGIDNRSSVVGYCVTRDDEFIGVIWESNGGHYEISDLNQRIDLPDASPAHRLRGARITFAEVISDGGQILVYLDSDSGLTATGILSPR